jgi:hypothetical protein
MDHLHETLRRVEEYAAAAGTSPDSVCRAATGNPRLFERLKRRAEYQTEVIAILNKHMAENPIVAQPATTLGPAQGNEVGDG